MKNLNILNNIKNRSTEDKVKFLLYFSFSILIIVFSVKIPQIDDNVVFTTDGKIKNIKLLEDTIFYISLVGCALWLIIFLLFNKISKITTSTEFIPFAIPFVIPLVLIALKYKLFKDSINNISKNPNLNQKENLNTSITHQLQREDVIVQTIPLILFGVGLVFENQKFYHNKFLLGGVFFGTGIPLMINSLLIDSENNIGHLIISEMFQFIFISIGITMVIQSLLKYYIFKQKQQKNKKGERELVKEIEEYCLKEED